MKKFHCLFLAFACAYSTLMAQTPAHIDLNVQLKDQNNDPVRDARLEVEITIEQNGAKVYKETRLPVWTNYDGYLSIQVGKVNPAQWNQIDWNAATKRVKIKARPDGQSGAQYEVLYDDFLQVAAYAHFVKPYERPGVGSINLFSYSRNPNIKILGNDPSSNYPLIDFATNASEEDKQYVARIRTNSGRNLLFQTRGGVSYFQKSPAASQIELWTITNPGINFKGGNPRVDFYENMADNSPRNGRIIVEGGTFSIQTSRKNIALDAGANSIAYTADQHVFNGGPLRVNGSSDSHSPGAITYVSKTDGRQIIWFKAQEDDDDLDDSPDGVPANAQGRLGSVPSGNSYTYGIISSSRILASSFHANSDSRIKLVQQATDSEDSRDILEKLKVFKYGYKDPIKMGTSKKFGFIAQEVEKTFPQAVSKTTDVIPDIFQIGKNVILDINTKSLTVTVDSLSDLKVGEKVRLLGEQQHLVEVVEVNGTTFKVKDWPEENTKEVFVYGREVDDFRTLDYDQIFTLNVSATQALIKEVEELKTQLAAQKQVSETLQSENQALKADLRTINGRIDALAKLVYEANSNTGFSKTGTN